MCAQADKAGQAGELLGQLRQLQGNLRGLQGGVAPACRPGFRDVTNGNAFDWACAFHCPGGPFATAQCSCACLSERQREMLGELQPPAQSARGSDLLLTTTPEPSREPPDPVIEAPVGDLGESEQDSRRFVRVNEFFAQEQQTTTSQPEVERDGSFGELVILSCAIVSLAGSAAIVAVATWGGFRKVQKGPKIPKRQAWADPPREHPMSLPDEKCPEPEPLSIEALEPPASSTGSTGASTTGKDKPTILELELEPSSIITKKCDAEGPSLAEAAQASPVFENEHSRGVQKPFLPAIKISRVQPVS